MEQNPRFVAGADPTGNIDAIFVNAPLRDYGIRPRVNDFTLPVLGMGYIATYAAARGFNVGVLDAEALGLGIEQTTRLVNELTPRWAGFNLLAPTYEISAQIASGLDPAIKIMVGGHQAKAMPGSILTDPRLRRIEALVLGEAETRVATLLDDHRTRVDLPGVMWLDPVLGTPVVGGSAGNSHHLAPRYQPRQLLNYSAVDLTSGGVDEAMRARDEFNFSVGIQFGEATLDEIRRHLTDLSRQQHERQQLSA